MTKITGTPPGTDTARIAAENSRRVTPAEAGNAAREFEAAKERVNSNAKAEAQISAALQKPTATPKKIDIGPLDHRIVLALQSFPKDPEP